MIISKEFNLKLKVLDKKDDNSLLLTLDKFWKVQIINIAQFSQIYCVKFFIKNMDKFVVI